HPGQYVLRFHHFATLADVLDGQEFRPTTGYFQGTDAQEQFLVLNKNDDADQLGLPVCRDGSMHLLAGSYFLVETLVGDERQDVRRFTHPVEVTPGEGSSSGYMELRREPIRKARSLDKDEGRQILPDEIGDLVKWGEKRSPFQDVDLGDGL